jgi:putative transposase
VKLAYKYKAHPTIKQQEELQRQFKTHATIFNKALETLDDEWIPKYKMYNQLPTWKQENPNLKTVHSKAAQETVGRIYRAISGLSAQKQNGRKVGRLRYKNSLNSIEYNQSGFKVNDDTVYLSKIGDIPITKHRPVEGNVKGVTIKQSQTSEWYISVIVDVETTKEIPIEDIEEDNVVGIDVNVSNLFADTEGNKLESLYTFLKPELERVRKEHRNLSRKEYESNNWYKQKQKLAKAYDNLVNKRDDMLHKLSRWYVEKYDLIALEDIDSKELSEKGNGLGKYIRSQAWSRFAEFVSYKASQAGTHVVQVDPAYTSQDCSNPSCDAREKKSLSEREHSCSECGLSMDRDVNAAWNVLFKSFDKIGQGLAELTPVETGTADETLVSLSSVVDAGSLDA